MSPKHLVYMYFCLTAVMITTLICITIYAFSVEETSKLSNKVQKEEVTKEVLKPAVTKHKVGECLKLCSDRELESWETKDDLCWAKIKILEVGKKHYNTILFESKAGDNEISIQINIVDSKGNIDIDCPK